jgi:hypothetical protein
VNSWGEDSRDGGMSSWGGDIAGGSDKVSIDEGGVCCEVGFCEGSVGGERGGAGKGKGETKDLRRMDKGVRLVAEVGGRPGGECGGGDEMETGQL